MSFFTFLHCDTSKKENSGYLIRCRRSLARSAVSSTAGKDRGQSSNHNKDLLKTASKFWHIHPKFKGHTELLQSSWWKFKGHLNSHHWLLEWCVQLSDKDLQKESIFLRINTTPFNEDWGGTYCTFSFKSSSDHSLFLSKVSKQLEDNTWAWQSHQKEIKNCSLIHCLAYKTPILKHSGDAGPSNVLQFSVPVICIPALCSNRIVSRKDIRLYIWCLISKEN